MLRFGCFERLLGNMSDHHICNFGQNSMFLHGGYLELKEPMHPHFVFFLNKILIKHSYILGKSVSQRNFLVRDKNKIFLKGATPLKIYHSAVPHENSAFENFA